MSTETTEEIPQVAGGRCSTCRFLAEHELPLRTVYFCRALLTEMGVEQKDAIRRCPQWEAFRAFTRRRRDDAEDLLSRELLFLERRIFGELRQALAILGADLKTIMLLAQPSLESASDLAWIDELDPHLPERPLRDLVPVLRELSYDALADHLAPFIVRETRRAA